MEAWLYCSVWPFTIWNDVIVLHPSHSEETKKKFSSALTAQSLGPNKQSNEQEKVCSWALVFVPMDGHHWWMEFNSIRISSRGGVGQQEYVNIEHSLFAFSLEQAILGKILPSRSCFQRTVVRFCIITLEMAFIVRCSAVRNVGERDDKFLEPSWWRCSIDRMTKGSLPFPMVPLIPKRTHKKGFSSKVAWSRMVCSLTHHLTVC